MLFKYKTSQDGEATVGAARIYPGETIIIDNLAEIVLTPFKGVSVQPIEPPFVWRGNALVLKLGGSARVGSYIVKLIDKGVRYVICEQASE